MISSISQSVLEFRQINLQHCKSASLELRRQLAVTHTDISFIQEPYLLDGKVHGLDVNYARLFYNPPANKTRACILIANNVNAALISQHSSDDIVAVSIKVDMNGDTQEIVVASVYLPFDSIAPPPSKEMKKLIAWCKSRNLPLLLGCDTNAHHEVWGCKDNNDRGDALLEFLVSTDLEILNKGDQPTFVNAIRETIIDMTLCSQTLVNKVISWEVTDDILTSDHRCIRFCLNIVRPAIVEHRNRRLTNWVSFSEHLGRNLVPVTEINGIEQIESVADVVGSAINAAFVSSCPLITNKSVQNKPFWNTELKELRKISRRLKNKARRSELQVDWDCFWESLKLYKKKLRAAYRKSWIAHCEAVNSIPALARMYRALNKTVSCQPDVLRLPNGNLTSDPKEVAELLLSTHFPGSSIVNSSGGVSNSSLNRTFQSAQQPAWEIASKVVTPEVIEWSVRSFKPFKSGGPDNIFPAELQHGYEVIKGHLLTLFRACIAFGYIPNEWTRVRVVFIPKIGKSSYWEAKSFRPISLTSTLLKVLERMIDRYIRFDCSLELKLCSKQHAYLTGKSCETALHQLVNLVERALDRKEFVVATFIDIEGAFDNTSFQSINSACSRHGIDQALIGWIDAMLRARCLELDVDGEKIAVKTTQGCPQGGVLSPLIWILVMDNLLTKLNLAGFPTQAYADDLVITISGKFLNVISELTQSAIRLVEEWCSHTGLSVNPNKTEMMVFTKRRKLEGLVIPDIYGQPIKRVDQVKHLGVILDNKLSWAPHLDAKIKKAANAFWQCRRYFGQTWGLSPKIMYHLYNSFVRPMFAYASLVWWPRVKLKTSVTKLNQLQRIACLAITGAMSTTPTLAVEVILSIPSLDLYILGSASSAAFRLNCLGVWEMGGKAVGHSLIWEYIKSEIPCIGMHSDHMRAEFNFNIPYSISYPTREWWCSAECNEKLKENIGIFTDGSVSEEGVGYGVYSPSLKVSISEGLGKIATIMQAETAAILCCAVETGKFNPVNKNICIYTDSQAALHALANPKITSRLVRDCREALGQLCSTNRVTLSWVPGHSGVEGNEVADLLAKSGGQHILYGAEPWAGLSLNAGKEMIKRWTFVQLARRWSMTSSCRQTKHFLLENNKRLSRYVLSLKKRDLRNLIQVVTGHGPFNVHLNRMDIHADPLCEFCLEDDDDAEHFVCFCPAFDSFRRKFLSSSALGIEHLRNLPWTKIMSFIKASERFRDIQ